MERFFNLDSFVDQTAFYAKGILLLVGFEALLETDFFGHQMRKSAFGSREENHKVAGFD